MWILVLAFEVVCKNAKGHWPPHTHTYKQAPPCSLKVTMYTYSPSTCEITQYHRCLIEESNRKQPLRVREDDLPLKRTERKQVRTFGGRLGRKWRKTILFLSVTSQKCKIMFGADDVSKPNHRMSRGPSKLPATGTMKSLKLSQKWKRSWHIRVTSA